MIATICLYALISVAESVSVKFSALYLVSKVSEKSGIGPPLINFIAHILSLSVYVTMYHFVWADQREKQGYKCDIFLKRGIQIIGTLEMMPLFI